MSEIDEARLNRIESKLDTLVEAMSQMIRFEEKMANHNEALGRFGFRMDDIEKRVEAIESKVPLLDLLLKFSGKIAVFIGIAIVGAVLSLVLI